MSLRIRNLVLRQQHCIKLAIVDECGCIGAIRTLRRAPFFLCLQALDILKVLVEVDPIWALSWLRHQSRDFPIVSEWRMNEN